jgi:hypothetical protein
MARKRAPHVVVVMAGVDPAEPRGHGLCQHCGARLVIELPVLVDVWLAANRAFIKAHTNCRDRRPARASSRPVSRPVTLSEEA